MNIQTLTQFFMQYGAGFIFLIVLLEYMNLPGFPAGIIMPLAGIWAARGQISFAAAMALTVSAGLLGSWILYFLGRLGGAVLLPRYMRRFPKQEALIKMDFITYSLSSAGGIFIWNFVLVGAGYWMGDAALKLFS